MNRKGFSLLEIVVSFSILIVGLVASLALLNRSISINKQASNRMTAVMLAEEAVAVIHNIRDSNVIEGVDWNDTLTGCSGCIIGYYSSCFTACDFNSSCQDIPPELIRDNSNIAVKYDASVGYYQRDISVCEQYDTIFTRGITIGDIVGDQILITVSVDWSDPYPHTYELNTTLFNLQ